MLMVVLTTRITTRGENNFYGPVKKAGQKIGKIVHEII